ncbi:MAG: hypothetical protein KA988_04810 [Longilinea sp.]|nr:hypothetical protein [Longilinea sp.]
MNHRSFKIPRIFLALITIFALLMSSCSFNVDWLSGTVGQVTETPTPEEVGRATVEPIEATPTEEVVLPTEPIGPTPTEPPAATETPRAQVECHTQSYSHAETCTTAPRLPSRRCGAILRGGCMWMGL